LSRPAKPGVYLRAIKINLKRRETVRNAKLICVVFAAITFLYGNSYAAKFVYDFDYQEHIDYFWINDIWFFPNPTPLDEGESGYLAFSDRVLTFVDLEPNNPSSSVDGCTLSFFSGGQFGAVGIYWNTPIKKASIELAVTGNVIGNEDILSMNVYNQGEMLTSSLLFDANSDISNLSLDLNFQSGFDCIWFKTLDLYDVDTITFSTPVPEPGSLLLLATGLISFAGLRKKNSWFSFS
jgi:hypothetical protein